MSQLEEILTAFNAMSKDQQNAVAAMASEARKGMKWIANPGPQTDAYFSKADILLYGGEPGGGKSDLLLGLAFNCHKRSLLMRRQYTDLAGLTENAIRINGSRDGFSGSPPPRLTLSNDQFIDFGAAKTIGDEQHFQGRPHDFIGLDEGTQFAYTQIRFLMGWLRHEDANQRCRVVIATNPPLSSEGLWVIEMFAPWLDPKHPNPAKNGELRWYITDEDGRDREVSGPNPIEMSGRLVRPLARTFIAASVDDNPYYAKGNYRAQLDAMVEPYRSILMGGFKTAFKDLPNQIIPTTWVQAAMKRWQPKIPKIPTAHGSMMDIPMCAMGVDASGGGEDPMIIAIRHDGWYAPLIEIPGKDIPIDRSGRFCAAKVLEYRSDDALVVIDMGGGYGGPMYEHLKENRISTVAYKGAESSTRRSSDGKRTFTNKRTAAYWQFREALDPGQPGGSPIALPEDSKLMSDLTAATFEITPNGIKAESKEKVCDRLGRSTDRGDAVVMAWHEGQKRITHALDWMDNHEMYGLKKARPQVIGSSRKPLSARRY